MDQKKPNFHNDPDTYQTGRTQPPKRYSGVIAFLIALVILLSGISTALSILNFKLYRQLAVQETGTQVSFSRGVETPDTDLSHAEDLALQGFGIRGTVIPQVYQRYNKLPNGIYVTQVFSSSEAFTKGIVAGDIITKIGDTPISDAETLEQLTAGFTPGQEISLCLYRSGTESSLTLVWED